MIRFFPLICSLTLVSIVFSQEGDDEKTLSNVEDGQEVVKKEEEIRTVPRMYYTILSKPSGNCVAISMGEKKDGGGAIEWTSKLGYEQQWRIEPVEGHWCQLVARHSDRALKVKDSDGPVVQGNTHGDKATHWKMVSDADGYVRFVNRVNSKCLAIASAKGSHGGAVVLMAESDTDRQKWLLQLAQIDYVNRLVSKELAIPASEIIGKKHPKNKVELLEFLHGTTWSVRYGSPLGTEEYRMSFDRIGKLRLHYGRESGLQVLGPKTIKLWNYDHASMSDQFNYFRGVDCNDKVYYGMLMPPAE